MVKRRYKMEESDASLLTPSPKQSCKRRMVDPRNKDSALGENNDEAERQLRREEDESPLLSTPGSSISKLSPNEILKQASKCFDLGVSNKITPKNAFQLKMIDLLLYSLKKKELLCLSNFQGISTSLDVSAKIYGCRVDHVHALAIRTAGITTKDKSVEINPVSDVSKERPVKKKKKKKTLLVNEESLKGKIETYDPRSFMRCPSDSQTSDMLLQVFGFFNNVLQQNVDTTRIVEFPCVEDFRGKLLCPTFSSFRFLEGRESDKEIRSNDVNDVTLESFEERCALQARSPQDEMISEFRSITDVTIGSRIQRQRRTQKEKLHYHYEQVDKDNLQDKFLPSGKQSILTEKTKNSWSKEKVRLFQTIAYDSKNLDKFFQTSEELLEYSNFDDDQSEENYDTLDSRDENQNSEHFQDAFIGDNLVSAPIPLNQVPISYARIAKRFNMGELKRVMWMELENQIEVEFSDLYRAIPGSLSKTNVESLSPAIAFVGLLHLACYKDLRIDGKANLSDLTIRNVSIQNSTEGSYEDSFDEST